MRFAFLSLDLGNSFNEILAQNIAQGFAERGHSLLVVEGSRLAPMDPATKPKNALYDLLPLDQLDGVIVSSLFGFVGKEEASAFMERFRGLKTVILTDRVEGYPSITVDNAIGFRDLVAHLADGCGCRRFAAITGPESHNDSIQRRRTLDTCLAERGLSLDPDLVFVGTYDFFDGVDGTSRFLDSGKEFDALVCFNDNMALGALFELRRRGIDVPGKLRVTGFDDILEARSVDPPLSTVTYPLDGLGRAGVEYMLGLIEGREQPPEVSIPSRFIARASTVRGWRFQEEPRGDGAGLKPGLPHEWLYSRKKSEILADIGEEIGTSFDPERIVRRLRFHLPRIGLEGFILALYDDPAHATVRFVCAPEGLALPRTAPALIPSMDLLKGEWGGAVVCCIHVSEEQLGFVMFPFNRSSGLVYKTLTSQISIAFSGVGLVEKVDMHSRELEAKVDERTAELRAANELLKKEMDERTKIEGLLLRQKNYESLGQLAGGIAHDFNNYLAGILGNIQLLKDERTKPEERFSCMRDLESIARKAAGLTRQLLTFSRGGNPIRKAMSVVPLVEETARFLLRGTAVTLRFQAGEALPESEVDADQLSQVLHNLVINAIQAMDGRGELDVSLRRKTLSGPDGTLQSGDYLEVDIRDSGCGMPPEVIERIFDPYFTTKAEGSGLGLSVSLSVVQRHGGDIRVKSEPGKGTTFSVFLPATEERAKAQGGAVGGAERSTHDAASGQKTPGLRILILEDEEIVGRALERLLRALGHQAVQTREGRETIEAYGRARDQGEPFDLVIADLTIIGGMGGLEAVEGLLKIDPALKAIVVSGYSDVGVMSDPSRFGFQAGLRKPYGLDDLKKAIAEIFPPAAL